MKLWPILLVAFLIWRAATATQRATAQLMRNSRPLEDWRLIKIARRFADTLETDRTFDVRILDMDQVNGLALPGGQLFISRGLYEKHLSGEVSEDEVAAVIAHEIGHVALGHHDRRLNAWRVETAAMAAIWLILSRAVLGWIGLLVVLGANYFRNRMNQRDEFEADAFSAQLMMRAEMNPNAMITLLRKLERWTDGAGTPPISWLSSHPPIPDRIDRAQAVIAAGMPSPTPVAD